MSYNSKYTGAQVEDLLDQVSSGNVGGGGGITEEADPIFSNSPAATITEEKIAEWDAKSEQGEKGDTGVGVQSVAQTTTSNADGGSNVVTVTLTDGTKSTFTVKNGSKGSNGSNGTNGKDGADGANGKDGADGATFTPSVDAAGNLSWSNDKGLTNPPTVNIKGPKGDKGDAGEGGSGSGGGPTVEFLDYQGLINIEDNKVYQILFSVTELTINIVPELYIGSVLRFKTEFEGCTLTMPDNVYWANGIIPDIKGNTCYELSLTSIDMLTILAVLTPFEYIE